MALVVARLLKVHHNVRNEPSDPAERVGLAKAYLVGVAPESSAIRQASVDVQTSHWDDSKPGCRVDATAGLRKSDAQPPVANSAGARGLGRYELHTRQRNGVIA